MSAVPQPAARSRIERDPANVAPDAAYRISDVELASRLSFFLWSSVPDDELLGLAIAGTLSQPEVLEQQTRRIERAARSTVSSATRMVAMERITRTSFLMLEVALGELP